LVDLHRVSLHQSGVGGDDIADAQPHQVAGHQLAGGQALPFPIPPDLGLDGQLFLEGGDGAVGLVLLTEAHHGIHEEQRHDNADVGPVAQHARQDGRYQNHDGDGAPEIGEELQDRADLFLFNLVVAVLFQPLLRLLALQAVIRRAQALHHLGDGQVFQRFGWRGCPGLSLVRLLTRRRAHFYLLGQLVR
jgi:hypothetical protein